MKSFEGRSKMTMESISKEQTIFNHIRNKTKTEDREINIIARLEEPLIVILGNVLSVEECDELIKLSKDKMHRSKIEKRISSIMNIPIEHGEGIQILKYTPGQEYKAHFFTS